MPNSTVFKSKWNTFITKIAPNNEHRLHQTRRRSSSEYNNNQQKRRKHSDAMSVGTCDSTITMADKFRQVIPFLRRRSSDNISSEEHTPTNTPPIQSSYNYCKEIEKLQSLYLLAVDEINYAEDSQGSSYYSGDLVTAREALDDCANAFMQLLGHTNDPLTREGLQSSMAQKLLKLQKRMDALPKANEDGILY
ncbi:hypothetical protein BDF21DRAFT_393981 [Thamnidium elegans]|nr:hypothetical protein BDF21DRAFT_393981 [Thamnidium elegans]